MQEPLVYQLFNTDLALRAQLAQAHDERNEYYNATVTLKGRVAHLEARVTELEAALKDRGIEWP